MLKSAFVPLLIALAATPGLFAADGGTSPGKTRAEAAGVVAAGVGMNQRASQIMGMEVKNLDGKVLGSINDIVLDPATGKVRYLAVSYGGWLGLGDKLFAVPNQAFQWRKDDNQKTYLVLNLSEERLKSAPGFDQDHWPDFATDKQWRQKVDTYYVIEKVEVIRPEK